MMVERENISGRRRMTKAIKMMVLVTALALAMSSAAMSAGTVVIKGSSTVLPVAQAAAEAYMKKHPGVNVSLTGGGSGDGIKSLIEKTTDIANSSRDMKKEELALVKSRGIRPVGHVVAIDAIVPIVSPKNKVRGLSRDQLSLIYQGKIRNWKEVGGDDLAIVVVSRDSSSGTFESWLLLVLAGARVTPRAQMQASSGAVVQTVSRNRYAIGYIGLGYLDKSVKALAVDGVTASVKTADRKSVV
jgi:phosphate transport system substrate-binding protein